jgi:hypothetical protein
MLVPSDAADPSVNGSSGTGAVNANATSGVTAELKNEIQKIVMGIVREQVPRAVKSAISETVPDALKAIMADLQPKQEPATQATPASNPADQEKVTSKARIEALEKQLQAFQQRTSEAEGRARDAAMRSRVQAEVAKFLPASDPNHAAYMGLLYDLQKRFADQDGTPVVKMRREWGEEAVPLDAGIKELFEGELKHLVQHSKAQNLPTAGYRGAAGQPMGQPKPGPRFNPLLAEVASAIGEARPEIGRQLMGVANGEIPSNGTAK